MARVELESGEVVCERCVVADNAFRRMKGLLGRSALAPDEGIMLKPCNSVHTFFMRFAIDVVFCDRELRVISVASDVAPWRMRMQRGAKLAFELAAGEADRRRVAAGSRLRLIQD
jgi:uncharacterized protein